jgi:hypothetical protein
LAAAVRFPAQGQSGAHSTTGEWMRFNSVSLYAILVFSMACCGLSSSARSQYQRVATISGGLNEVPDAPQPQSEVPASAQQSSAGQDGSKQSPAKGNPPVPPPKQQPKRILGVMPNYRAVSAGAIPPPPTPGVAFKIASQNSFDYSSFVFVGITSLLAKGTDAHPQLGKGPSGYWAYYWRGFVDKTDGNYWVIFALPTVTHEDERYFTKGEGGIFKRGIYAASRVLITPDYHGHETFNASEVFGRGIAQGISLAYYPSSDQTFAGFAEKYGYAVGRDALTNVFREFWPDIDSHLIHRHRRKSSLQ